MRAETRALLAEYHRIEKVDDVIAEARKQEPRLDRIPELRFGIEIICAANRLKAQREVAHV